MDQPQPSDFSVYLGTSNGNGGITVPVASTSIQVSNPTPSSTTAQLSANSTYTITLSATANIASLPGSGSYAFYLRSASTTVYDINGNPQVQTTAAASLTNFYTTNTSVSK